MKPIIANNAVRTPHVGVHVSAWWPDIDKQIFSLVLNRPLS